MTSEPGVTTVDVVVGLTSYNNAGTIGGVATAVRAALSGQLAGTEGRVVVADAGSTDGTLARAREALHGGPELLEVPATVTTADVLDVPYHRMPGKARAVHGILTAARNLGARACLIFDAGVESVTPQWVDWLSRPVLAHEFDYVSPYYRRHPYEGALTKGLVYPMFRALYGVRLRQPAGGEVACSSRLLDHLLREDIWEREGAQVGIDLWLATASVSGDFRLGEAALGARTHRAHGDEPLDLGTTITQVVGSLFADLETRVDRWQRVRGSVPVQPFGEPPAAFGVPRPGVDHERLIESFRLGYRELRDIWTYVLPPRTIVDLRRLVDSATGDFRLDDELWARIVYDFALGFRLRVLARDHLLRSLVPLYLAWLASFILQVRGLTTESVDERIERLCAVFEAQKPYLISKWRWPERLRS